jgi:hypothetical protein
MKRRDALVGLPAVMYAAACHAEQDKPTPPPGTGYGQTPPPDGKPRPVYPTEKVELSLAGRSLNVKPQIFLLLVPKDGIRSSLKWDINVPADHTLEINFVVDYEGDAQLLKNNGKSVVPKRGPFAPAKGQARGRYVSRGRAVLESGLVDVGSESYWKYEVTVTDAKGDVVAVVDPGGIIKEWP